MLPTWLTLLAPLPDDVLVERMPVAPTELVESGQADAIAGWESIRVYLSDAARGLRHVLITLDAGGTLLSGGDTVMFHRVEQRGSELWNIYDHEHIGGRFEADGSFLGTRWHTHNEHVGDDDEPATTVSAPSTPTAEEIEKLRGLVNWVIARAPERRP